MSELDVVLPSGGRISGEFARNVGVDVKALIPLGDGTLLSRTVDAMRSSGRVRRIVVIGPDAVLDEAKRAGADGCVGEGETGPENVFRGIDWLSSQPGGVSERIIISGTDLPFLDGDAIGRFLDACPNEADVCVPVIRREWFLKRFPGSANTWVPLREGEITNGSVFRVNPELLLRNRERFAEMFAARKDQLKMAKLVGWRIAIELLTKRLSVATLERRCSEIVGGVGKAVFIDAAELAFDIDEPTEYAYVIDHLAALQSGGPKT